MFNKIYSTKINVAANFIGSSWSAVLGILFVPLYLHYITIETYGLIGIFSSIQAVILLLDFGLSPTLTREFARLSALENQAQEIRDLKRTLEIPNWIFAVFIALFLAGISPFFARYWLKPQDLSLAAVTAALVTMSVNVGIQFSTGFYTGGLYGLQKQLLINSINIICGTLRSVGAYMVLAFFSATIEAFLLWQTVIAVLQFLLIAVSLNYSLPTAPKKSEFKKDVLKKIWRYAAGMTGITLVSLILTQTDKVILSRILDLKTFGYYTLAGTISSMAIVTIVSAVNAAAYPKFSGYVSVGDEDSLCSFYHRSCQILSSILIPAVAVLSLFSYQILVIWTDKPEIAANTYLLLSLTTVGAGLNAMMWLPYHAQLAHGWVKLTFYTNVCAIFILIPLIIFGVYKYGAVGGASALILLNSLYILITIQIMHRRILKNEMLKWYFGDLLIPAVVAGAVAGAGKFLMPIELSKAETCAGILIISVVTLFFTTLSTKAGRQIIQSLMGNVGSFAGNFLNLHLRR